MREQAAILAPQFEHAAVFYHSTDEYLDAVLGFVAAGLEHANPVLVAVPGPKIGLLRERLDGAERVSFADMTELGANPARIIPQVAAFADAHRGRSVRFVGEPIWAARTAAEVCEATRHEALINLAFARTAASILCPYDRTRLAPGVIADAERTHPVLIQNGLALPSRAYPEGGLFPPGCDPIRAGTRHEVGGATFPVREEPHPHGADLRDAGLVDRVHPAGVSDDVTGDQDCAGPLRRG